MNLRHFYIDRWKICVNRVECFEDIVSIVTNLQNSLLQHWIICRATSIVPLCCWATQIQSCQQQHSKTKDPTHMHVYKLRGQRYQITNQQVWKLQIWNIYYNNIDNQVQCRSEFKYGNCGAAAQWRALLWTGSFVLLLAPLPTRMRIENLESTVHANPFSPFQFQFHFYVWSSKRDSTVGMGYIDYVDYCLTKNHNYYDYC